MIMVYRYNCCFLIFFLCSCLYADLDAKKRKKGALDKGSQSCCIQEAVQEESLEQQEKDAEENTKEEDVGEQEKKERRYIVRVLLYSWTDDHEKSIQLKSPEGFWVIDPQNKSHPLVFNTDTLSIDTIGGNLCLEGKKVARDHFYLVPKEGCISFNGRQYKGAFLIVHDRRNILLINCVDLEDYICSVLHTESWPGWPLEVNKVFAIASRSYTIAMMQQANKKNSSYHVCNTNLHQTYTGTHSVKILHDAVEQTKGLFLTYENKPVIAMFDSCCGGIVPAHIINFDFVKAPYLARSYPCEHCKCCKIYQWKVKYDRTELEQIFASLIPNFLRLKDMRVSKKDKAGLVQEVMLKPGSYTTSGKRLYSLLKGVKSFCFTIRRNKTTFTFTGRGFGHHLGLCQWGAYEMVSDGFDYKRILYFYYPGTKLARLSRVSKDDEDHEQTEIKNELNE
ncbi:SpoIID/LytB domain-containing protein [Candidatus Dependentiae bacterium]|nr:MAG: SpoIID/LytB domain-containing protein [Candidatus Dependentiae bacterium]